MGSKKTVSIKLLLNLLPRTLNLLKKIAPFLGQVSLCLEKGLFLYPHFVLNEELALCRPKFVQLADSLLEVAQIGEK